MYFPYLRARQFELITLRDLVSEGALQDKIIPVKEVLRNNDINVVVNGHSFDLENFSSVLLEYADREIELLTEKLKQTIAGL